MHTMDELARLVIRETHPLAEESVQLILSPEGHALEFDHIAYTAGMENGGEFIVIDEGFQSVANNIRSIVVLTVSGSIAHGTVAIH